jgi:HPr kinase/phosphorylase
MTVHGTALAINGRAVLIRGPSGAGKSDLALRLLAQPGDALRAFGVMRCEVALIADDRVVIDADGLSLWVSAPAPLRGKLEVRGIGIVDVEHPIERATLALIVDLVQGRDVERMPDAHDVELLGVRVPVLHLAAFEAATPLKIALATLAPHRSE